MNKSNEKTSTHTAYLQDRSLLNITGVENVISFDENSIILLTSLGELNIDGENLKVVKLSVEDGEVSVQGKVFGLYYVDGQKKRGGFFAKKSDR